MKKFLWLLLMTAGLLTACSKDDDKPQGGQLKIEGMAGTELAQAGTAGGSRELALTGVTGEVTAKTDPGSASWCRVEVKKETGTKASAAWKLIITTDAYKGIEDRKAYITVRSGPDELILTLVQQGTANDIKLVVLSEGFMGGGNAFLSALSYADRMKTEVFKAANNRPLGDVGQFMTCINGQYFVTLNNSNKIEVMDPLTFKSTATIVPETAAKPRYIAAINEEEAVVSDLGPQLMRINTKTYKVVETIDLSDKLGLNYGVEQMAVAGGKLICQAQGPQGGIGVYDLNNVKTGAMRIVSTGLPLVKTCEPVVDKHGKVWFLAGSGGWSALTRCALYRFDPASETIDKTVTVPMGDPNTLGDITGVNAFTRMGTDRTKGKLYFYADRVVDRVKQYDGSYKGTSGGVIVTLDVDKDAVDAESYRELAGLGMMYGMGISPDGEVYVCDCLDYSKQRGFLRRYNADGSVDSFRVGVYPNLVHFTEYNR